MASLMEELFTALEGEKEIYEQLIPISEKKTGVLIRGELKELEEVTHQPSAADGVHNQCAAAGSPGR